MQAKEEYRDRPDTEVAVLDALVERSQEGMTVFELRAAVDVDIDSLEDALAVLKDDHLIHVDREGEAVRITPANRVVPDSSNASSDSNTLIDVIRDRLGF